MHAVVALRCPRCGTSRSNEATACAKCGLATERMATFAAELEATVPDVVRAAWDAARARWDEAAAHDELLRLTTLHGCYAWVAYQYRQVVEAEPDDVIAAQQLARMRKAAEVAMLSTATKRPHERTPYRSSMIVLGLVLFLILLGVVYARWQLGNEAPPPEPAPHAPQVR